MAVLKALASALGTFVILVLGLVGGLLTLVFAGWHGMVVVWGLALLLGALALAMGGQSVTQHFKAGRQGVWAMLTFPFGAGLSLVLLGAFGWRAAVLTVVAAFVLTLVQGGLLIVAGFRAGREFVEEVHADLAADAPTWPKGADFGAFPDLGDLDHLGGFPGSGHNPKKS